MSSLVTTARYARLRRPSNCSAKPLQLARRAQSGGGNELQLPQREPTSPTNSVDNELRQILSRERKLDYVRQSFFPPGQSHLRFGQVDWNAAESDHVSELLHQEKGAIAKQLTRCSYRSDYVTLIKAILAQKEGSDKYRQESCRFVCNYLYYNLKVVQDYLIDEKTLLMVNQIRHQLQAANIALPESLVAMGLLSAANCRNLPSLSYFFRVQGEIGYGTMAPHLFDALASMLSGDWDNQVRPTVWAKPWDRQYATAALAELSNFVPHGNLNSLQRWLTMLGRLGLVTWMQGEWFIWTESEQRMHPEQLPHPEHFPSPVLEAAFFTQKKLSEKKLWNTKTRGDLIFLDGFLHAGAIKEAWRVLQDSGIPFDLLKYRYRKALLKQLHLSTPEVWTDEMKKMVKPYLFDIYVKEMSSIEDELGVVWVWDEKTGTGYHRTYTDSEYMTKRVRSWGPRKRH